ncbi:MAG TPA: hypothetical protein VG326_09695 [Tepidisphaeraceae bacterium]|jgi:uncharacterized integral membrane protein|nr:hypothetical protein [Tepidisphaeraceae bacterium]
MGKFWMKIWVWIKVIVFACLAIYVIAFAVFNHEHANFWVWPGKPPIITTTIVLAFWSFIAGVLATLLIRTSFKTMRQIRDLQDRGRHEKMQRDLDEVKAKAAMLRSRPSDEKSGQT